MYLLANTMWFKLNQDWVGAVDKLTEKQTKILTTKIKRNKSKKQPKSSQSRDKRTRTPLPTPPPSRSRTPSSLRTQMEEKLSSSKFRWLNEQLYTQHSSGALQLFTDSPQMFSVYHKGFTRQTQKWPINPLDRIISHLRTLPEHLRVADLGCGEGRLCLEVNQEVLSYDLVAVNNRVTACDMRSVPLEDACMDIVVFCLSLMGTNTHEFLLEGRRVLKHRGELIIAEISSRFEDIEMFIESVEWLDFKLLSREEVTDMFVLMRFRRKKDNFDPDAIQSDMFSLKPCLYKKR